ncbi:cell division protein MraZ [Aureimonas sp. Leaf454]|uniref:division/cell wall cluster transcriptional repressor MraZ n=1 Tax=Aureimonas sp. Leaf454 TaxID=1736381 RepID=UPI0006FC4E58|nr:division/cell wall cluster transcriptional repressor MraZ [Aureimonas sp. Leaf454]KQT50910.1 cell division protein MraZ [Aureimonas sp. Leaf454]
MDRFLSNAVNNIDAKGRVSVPASFRQVLAARGFGELYALQSIGHPAIDVGGMDLLKRYEDRMEAEDPFSEAYADMSLFTYGDGAFLKFDAEGRISVTDFIRSHTGITDRVVFVGRNHFFQLWEPSQFEAHRAAARARLVATRASGALAATRASDATKPGGSSA